jgi:hypothetical protein
MEKNRWPSPFRNSQYWQTHTSALNNIRTPHAKTSKNQPLPALKVTSAFKTTTYTDFNCNQSGDAARQDGLATA